jgi:DNA-binding GntR family transcriptional regulator
MAATDDAYAFTKERILDGRFAGGELISEGDVSTGVGLSRTPVREAFLRLESEGFLRLYPKRGALVVPVSASDVHSVMETRLLIERFAIEKAMPVTSEVRKGLEQAIATQEHLTEPEHAGEFVEADREFHRLFVAAAANPILLQLHDSMRDRQRRMGLSAIAHDAERARGIVAEHRRLAKAVIAGDAARAVKVLTEHLDKQLAVLLRVSS